MKKWRSVMSAVSAAGFSQGSIGASRTPGRRRWHRGVSALAALVLGAAALTGTAVVSTAAVRPTPGESLLTAAASCWEIKVLRPDAPDGVYWLVTPTLKRPAQFYCDMSTDGGGWVLIGRGREGWRAEYEGLGTPAQVRSVVTGPGAFKTRQLSSLTIDGLLDGGRVDALTDGIRLRRAADPAGTTWQDVRFQLRQRDRWVWTFRAKHPLRWFSIDGVSTPSSVTTYDFGYDTAYRRVNTEINGLQAWNAGWAYGPGVTGTTGPDTYVWSAVEGRARPLPFTQMYLRPKLMSADLSYPQVPAGGLPETAQRRLAQTRALISPWGVAGLASNGGENTETRSEVQAFAQIGSTMYVGGNFTTVQQSSTGQGLVEQSYLAAFDVTTDEFVPGFRPTFNNQIKALAALPNGTLAVGGEFTEVNGASSAPLVVLDPVTGAKAPGFSLSMRSGTSAPTYVRSLTVGTTTSGSSTRTWLYVGGSFTHVAGGGQSEAYARSAARVDPATGAPDKTWTPLLNGTVNDITPSQDGTRVYLAGFFTAAGTTTMYNVGVLSAAAGAAVVPWTPTYSVDPTRGKAYQWTVSESANRVWHGGSQHNFVSYAKGPLTYASGGIAMQGGDIQTSVVDGDLVYAGCHCIDYFYSGVTTYGWPTSFPQADKIGFVGAFDEATGAFLPEFDPILDARGGYGAWASMVDSTGVLWIGGSFTRAINVLGVNQWAGGFARYAPRDAQAPTAPTGLDVQGSPGQVSVQWAGIAESGVDYEILENGRVVAVTTGTSAVLPLPQATASYAVRAVDPAGNRSASTPPATVDPGSIPVLTTALAYGADWAWRYDVAPVDPQWSGTAFDDATWTRGAAPLGFGTSAIATVIHTGASTTRPITAYFRRSFQVADPATVTDVAIDVLANDGVVVYLNGVEIGRKSMPAGTISPTSYATTTAPSTLRINVPSSVLQAGTNVLTAETHLNYRGTRDIGFDAQVVLTSTPTGVPTPPTPPAP